MAPPPTERRFFIPRCSKYSTEFQESAMSTNFFIGLEDGRLKCYFGDAVNAEVAVPMDEVSLILTDGEYLTVGIGGTIQFKVSMSRVVDLAGAAYTGVTYTSKFLTLVNLLYTP